MSLGGVSVFIVTGGATAAPNGADLARQIVGMGVCTAGVPNTVYSPGSVAGMRAALGLGPLSEEQALVWNSGGPAPLAVPLNPSGSGGTGTVTHAGTGYGTLSVASAPHLPISVLCSTGGTLGNAYFQFSTDGGNTWTPPVKSASGSTWTTRVPGVFCGITFSAATYSQGATGSVGIDGTLGGTISSDLSISASPIDNFDALVTVTKAGLLGTAQVSVSVDNGATQLGSPFLLPASGVVVVPNTGLVLTLGQPVIVVTIDGTNHGALGTMTFAYTVNSGNSVTVSSTTANSGSNFVISIPGTGIILTFAPGTYPANATATISATGMITDAGSFPSTLTAAFAGFVVGDTYSFPCSPPVPSGSDITAAFTALLQSSSAPLSCVIDLTGLNASASAAFSSASAIESLLDTAFSNGRDWLAMVNCPTVGDVINSSGTVSIDSADTRTVIKTARASTANCNRVSVFEGTDNVQSAIGQYQVRRPRSVPWAARIAAKLPVESDNSTVATRDAPLNVTIIGDDERIAAVSLYDAQVNTFQTVQGGNVYLAIGRGYYGWQNLTTDAILVDADGFRAVNAVLAGFRPIVAKLIGRRFPINSDGTLAPKTLSRLSGLLDAAIKQAAGIGVGAQFNGVPQVSDATAAVDPSTNLGPSGNKVMQVNGSVTPLGFNSAVNFTLYFQGGA